MHCYLKKLLHQLIGMIVITILTVICVKVFNAIDAWIGIELPSHLTLLVSILQAGFIPMAWVVYAIEVVFKEVR